MNFDELMAAYERASRIQGCSIEQLVAAFPRIFHGEAPQCSSHVSPGWREIVWEAFRQIDELVTDEQAAQMRVGQIKEKFGSLRIYIGGIARSGAIRVIEHATHIHLGPSDDGEEIGDRVQAIINAAVEKSAQTCDLCGRTGNIQASAGYYAARCDAHRKTAWDEWNLRVLRKYGGVT